MTTADIRPIDEPYAGRILTRKVILLGNLLTLVPALLMFAGMGLAGWAAYDAFEDRDGPRPDPAVTWALIGVGIAVAGPAGYWGLRNTTWLANQYLRRLARAEVRSRPDPAVDPDDPDALFVEIVPRENWRVMLETATDVGYLLVDDARREVRFEGDRERMVIPAGAIEGCDAEHTVVAAGTPGALPISFTVLYVRDGAGVRELPFAYRGDLGQFGAGVRHRRAEALADRILDLIDRR